MELYLLYVCTICDHYIAKYKFNFYCTKLVNFITTNNSINMYVYDQWILSIIVTLMLHVIASYSLVKNFAAESFKILLISTAVAI